MNATMRANLLVELLVEELPPKALKRLAEAFASLLAGSLKAQGLVAADAAITPFATPRRLAVHVVGVQLRAADTVERKKLMPVSVAFDASGQVTPSAKKRLQSMGAESGAEERLQRAFEGKSEFVYFDAHVKGAALDDGLQRALSETLAKLPIPKVMQYQFTDGWTSVNFVRPAHGLVALHGADVVNVTALGLASSNTTLGHRFEAAVPRITLRHADSYAEQLRVEGTVIASYAERRAEVVRQLNVAAAAEGLRPIDDEALVDEVTSLVERPNVLLCRFEKAFLAVPPECLILTMKANQKYFPLLDGEGRLTERFLVVSNITPADPSRVIEGNQRVVRPRLADAKFFFDQDRKKTLESRVASLDKVVYHGKLGTQGERVTRVRAIAKGIALALGGAVLAEQADRAALLAKADLLTDMVGEFPELQGVMGGYYARHDGETEAVAFAIEDHYKPRFAGDTLPRGDVGIAVALADKLETLAGLFGVGQVPTGDKDPFALRRHALGVIRMLIECKLALSWPELCSMAFAVFPLTSASVSAEAQGNLLSFVEDRLTGFLREQGSSAHEVDAVMAQCPDRLAELPWRLAAVRAFNTLPEAAPLAAANKRVSNILRKSDVGAPGSVNTALLIEPAEVALHAALADVAPRADAAFAVGDYTASLQTLAALKAPVDAFFDAVMVNADDVALRHNRLVLLAALHAAMNRVADLSRLAA